MQDRYDNSVTTHSEPAFAAYCEGVDLWLSAQAGGIEWFQEAVKLDPRFCLARADLARALQTMAQPVAAREQIALALEHSETAGLSEQELAHIHIVGLLVGGKSGEAFEAIKIHLRRYPRDVLMLSPCCGVFGLIGFSGRANREQENAEFMAQFVDNYQDDWWFNSQYAFALCEIGELARAEALNDNAFAANPNNANAVHHRAHIHYETQETVAGQAALNSFRETYSQDSILHCHLAWHSALWALGDRDETRLWDVVRSNILPDVASAPPINVMTDLVAVLLRSELAGVRPPVDLWQQASDYAALAFPKPGVSFADAHSAVAHAWTGDHKEALKALQETQRGWASDCVQDLAKAFEAFAEQDWRTCLAALDPALVDHQRLGGSRAQRDMLELVRASVQTRLGQTPNSARFRETLPNYHLTY